MAERWRQGMTQAERVSARERIADWYADHGHDEDHEMRKLGSPGCSIGSHVCDREMPGGAGCPCKCHDARADEIAALTEALARGGKT